MKVGRYHACLVVAPHLVLLSAQVEVVAVARGGRKQVEGVAAAETLLEIPSQQLLEVPKHCGGL